jgi:hypothetical protein
MRWGKTIVSCSRVIVWMYRAGCFNVIACSWERISRKVIWPTLLCGTMETSFVDSGANPSTSTCQSNSKWRSPIRLP